MNKKISSLTKFVIGTSLTVVLAACSGSPSVSDVKKGVVSNLNLDSCELFKLTKFDKVNGIKQDDSHYQMEMSGEFIMKPLSKNVDYLKALESYFADNKDAFAHATSELSDLGKKLDAGSQQLNLEDPEVKAAVIKGIYEVAPDIRAVAPFVDAQNEGVAELYYRTHQEELDLATKDVKIVTDYREHQLTPASVRGVLYKNIAAECRNVSAQLVGQFSSNNGGLDAFKDELTLDFTYTYQMQKTDNGWQIAG
jgi:hypothetical protein